MQGLRDLEHGVKELGFVGAHFYPHWFGLPPDHAKWYPYYAKCCELDIPVMLQVGHNLICSRERRLPSVGKPICLDQVAIDFPDLKILGIDIGVPWTDEMISMAWKHENVFIGVDAYAPKHWPASLVHDRNSYGRHKVLFGHRLAGHRSGTRRSRDRRAGAAAGDNERPDARQCAEGLHQAARGEGHGTHLGPSRQGYRHVRRGRDMNRRTTLAIALAASFAAIAAAPARAQEEIILGATVPITGNFAATGINYYNSLRMAQDDINAAGGIGGRKVEDHLRGFAVDEQHRGERAGRSSCARASRR